MAKSSIKRGDFNQLSEDQRVSEPSEAELLLVLEKLTVHIVVDDAKQIFL